VKLGLLLANSSFENETGVDPFLPFSEICGAWQAGGARNLELDS
jgi:hypothetical protein